MGSGASPSSSRVIFLMKPAKLADCEHRMFIYNSDGSIPEMCGNGIRCLAKFIQELEGTQGLERVYNIETGAGKIVPRIRPDGLVCVDMGAPILGGAKYTSQFSLEATNKGKVVDQKITVHDKQFDVTCVSMG